MNIFILEDDSRRMDFFNELFVKETITHTDSVDVAKELLSKNKYNLIFLDHDLGGMAYVSSEEENTGYQVAQKIPATINKDTLVIVHSWNPVGAKNIVTILEKKGVPVQYIPFGNFDRRILNYASK